MSRQLVVEIVGDSTKFTSATKGAITEATGLTGKLQGIGKGMVLGAGIGAFNLLTGAISGAVGKLDEAHEAFLADKTSQDLLAQALKNNLPAWDGSTAAVEAYAAAQLNLGFADDEVRASLGQLVGITKDQTAAMELNSLAQDLARAKGISLASATDIVTKAAQGQGRGLKALGIDVTGATSAADILAAAQKNVAGASEAWIATNGTASVSNLKVGEAMEKVGGIIDKVSQVAVPLLAGALVGIVDVLTSSVGPAIQFVSDNMDLFGPVAAALALVLSAVLIPPVIAYTVAAGAAAVATLAAAAPFIAVGAAIAGVIFILKKLGILDVIMDKIQEVSKIVLPALSKAFEVVGGIIGTVSGAIGKAIGIVVDTVLPPLSAAFTAIGTVVDTVFGAIASTIKGAFNLVVGAINSVIRAVNSIKFNVDVPNPFGGTLANVGFDGLNLPTLPYLHAGGVVPGAPGSDVLAVLQAGELVTPAGRAGGPTTITIGTVVMTGVNDPRQFLQELKREVDRQGLSLVAS